MRTLPALVLAVALLVWAPTAGATPTTAPPTSAPFDNDCVSALPKPECGTEPQESGDRGGAAQLALFGIMVAGLAVVGVVVVRSTRRKARAVPSD